MAVYVWLECISSEKLAVWEIDLIYHSHTVPKKIRGGEKKLAGLRL